MAVKHTPAPWRIEGSQIRAEDFVTLADLHEWINDTAAVREEAKANARLIAAAPDLLEALQELVPLLEATLLVTGTPEPGSVGYRARAAIAKATGES